MEATILAGVVDWDFVERVGDELEHLPQRLTLQRAVLIAGDHTTECHDHERFFRHRGG